MNTVPKWLNRAADLEAEAILARHRAVAVRPAPQFRSPLSAVLAPIVKEIGPSAGTLESRWREIVGARLADVTRPLRLESTKKGSVLHVRAPSAAAPLLQHSESHILQRVSLAAGVEVVRLVIVQTAATAPRKTRSRIRPLSATERQTIASNVAGVRSDALRKALSDLGEAVIATESPR